MKYIALAAIEITEVKTRLWVLLIKVYTTANHACLREYITPD